MIKKILASLLIFVSAISFAQNGFTLPSVDPQTDSLEVAAIRARLDSIRQHRPVVALVLAGGGVNGLVHIGVLRYMHEMGIPVDLIGGTSMGGLVSGMFALGYDYKQMDSLVRAQDWETILSDRIPEHFQSYASRKDKERFVINVPFHYEQEDMRRKVINAIENNREQSYTTGSGDILDETVRKMGLGLPDGLYYGYNVSNLISSISVGYQNPQSFADLPTPMFCVSTDMVTLKPYNWFSGSVVDALRSTMSVPVVFRPVRDEGYILVDGACSNNFPTDIADGIGADIVIGSEIPDKTNVSDLSSLVSIMLRTIPLMSRRTYEQNRDRVDVLLSHDFKTRGLLAFDSESVDHIIASGYESAQKYHEKFEEIARRVGTNPTPSAHKSRVIDLHQQKVHVGSIRVEGLTAKEYKSLISPLFLPKDMMFGSKEIESIMARISGTRAFESVTFRMEGKEDPYTLVFECQKGQTHEAGVVAHIDTDEGVYLGGYVALNTRKLFGLSFRTDLKLGNVSALNMKLSYKASMSFPSINLSFNNQYARFSASSKSAAATVAYLGSNLNLFLEDTRMIYGKMRLGVSADAEPYEDFISGTGTRQEWNFRSGWFSAFADLLVDTEDDRYFPTRGVVVGAKGRYVFNGYSTHLLDTSFNEHEGLVSPYFVGTAHLSGVIPIGRRFFIHPDVWMGYSSLDSYNTARMHSLSAGGYLAGRYMDTQMPFFGFANGLFFCDRFAATATLNLRYAATYKDYFTLRAGTFMDSPTVSSFFGDPVYAVGVEYGRKSIVGPLKVGASWCSQTGFAFNLAVGMDF